MLFACIASFLWIVTSVYSIGYMRGNDEQHQTRFYICFAIAISSVMGLAFSANMFTLFIFYEVLTLSTYPLVTHSGTPEAMRAGRTYLGLLLTTSIGFQLTAILWTYSTVGSLTFRLGGILPDDMAPVAVSVLLALYMFGIGKAALMPFPSLAARRDGRPDAGQRPAPRRCRGEGWCLHRGQGHRLHLWHRISDRKGCWRVADLCRRGDRDHRVDRGPASGPSEAPSGLFDHQPAFLHHAGRRGSGTAFDRWRRRPHRGPMHSARSRCSLRPARSTPPRTRTTSASSMESGARCRGPWARSRSARCR